MHLPLSHPLNSGGTADSLLIQAYQGVRGERAPIWMMRQAGRSLPEYRALREGISMLDACLRPEIAAEITLQPVRRHKVDAAIFFSDIVIPLRLAGVAVEIVSGVGPVLADPVRSWEDFRKLRELDPNSLQPIADAIAIIIAELGATPLIGFAGAPFTLASYLIEGGPSQDLPHSRRLIAEEPELWNEILNWVAGVTSQFLRAQVLAGASAIQLFDSWAGKLTLDEYRTFAAPHSRKVMNQVMDLPVARVHFGVKSQPLLKEMLAVGATVMGVDSDTPLDLANEILGGAIPLQGNINPDLLAAPWDILQAHVEGVLQAGLAAPAHVVNLGHGVPPGADPELLTRLVAFVQGE